MFIPKFKNYVIEVNMQWSMSNGQYSNTYRPDVSTTQSGANVCIICEQYYNVTYTTEI